jgi:hypothetical protein
MTTRLYNALILFLAHLLFAIDPDPAPFDRRECEEYLQTEYGAMIHEARRQVWVNDVEARIHNK